jgi:hypothetical protein
MKCGHPERLQGLVRNSRSGATMYGRTGWRTGTTATSFSSPSPQPAPIAAVLRLSGGRETFQCCGSGMFIPDPTFFHPGSELSPSRIRIKEFKYFIPKKWFLSSKKYDPGCSSRIRMLTFYPSRIPDPDPQH